VSVAWGRGGAASEGVGRHGASLLWVLTSNCNRAKNSKPKGEHDPAPRLTPRLAPRPTCRTPRTPNRLTALVGLSGSGKSTLVALLLRLYDPSEGALLLDGRDLRGLDAAWFRSQVGVVSQVSAAAWEGWGQGRGRAAFRVVGICGARGVHVLGAPGDGEAPAADRAHSPACPSNFSPTSQEPKLLSLDISSNILYGCPWPATQVRAGPVALRLSLPPPELQRPGLCSRPVPPALKCAPRAANEPPRRRRTWRRRRARPTRTSSSLRCPTATRPRSPTSARPEGAGRGGRGLLRAALTGRWGRHRPRWVVWGRW
jgi:hypothetical protein